MYPFDRRHVASSSVFVRRFPTRSSIEFVIDRQLGSSLCLNVARPQSGFRSGSVLVVEFV
jgi:hypothetical protein